MSREALARFFGIVAGFVSLYSLSAWSLSQGGTVLSAVPGLDPLARVTSAYFAIVIIGICLSAACVLAIAHARQPVGQIGWRFPIVGLGDTKVVRPRAWSVRVYVGFLFVVLLLLPAAALVHLNRQLAGDGIVWNSELPGASAVTAGCALPGFWPFGNCDNPLGLPIAQALGRDVSGAGSPDQLWLVNKRCDIAWARGMAGPQVANRLKQGGSVESDDEAAAWRTFDARQTAVGSARTHEPGVRADTYCAGPYHRSGTCAENLGSCRGVQWVYWASPLLVMVPSLVAWGLLAWLVVELALHWIGPGRWKRKRTT